MSDYQIEVWRDSSTGSTRTDLISNFLRIEYSRTVNAIGLLTLDLPYDYPRLVGAGSVDEALPVDTRLVFLRRPTGGDWQVEGDTHWFVRRPVRTVRRGGDASERYLQVTAVSAVELLKRRIIAYKQKLEVGGARFADNKGNLAVDDLMKRIVRQNLGSQVKKFDGTAASSFDQQTRDLSSFLQVESDQGDGPAVKKSFHWRNVLQTLQELVQAADTKGSFVAFDIAPGSGSQPLAFRTYLGQRGADHASLRNLGIAPSAGLVSLSVDVATLLDTEWGTDRLEEINFGYALRREEQLVRRRETARIEASVWNRREAFVDASSAVETTEAQDEADTLLRDGKPRKIFTASIGETEGLRRGIHWDWGDRVLAVLDGEQEIVRVDGIRVEVRDGGQETSDATLVVEDLTTGETD